MKVVKSDIAKVDSRLDVFRKEIKADIAKLCAKVDSLRREVKVDIEKVLAAVHRVELLVKEQSAGNKYVLGRHASRFGPPRQHPGGRRGRRLR